MIHEARRACVCVRVCCPRVSTALEVIAVLAVLTRLLKRNSVKVSESVFCVEVELWGRLTRWTAACRFSSGVDAIRTLPSETNRPRISQRATVSVDVQPVGSRQSLAPKTGWTVGGGAKENHMNA